MLKRLGLASALTVLMLGTSALSAEAVPITGGISIFGSYLPVNGQTGAAATLSAATGIDFTNLFSSIASPGVAGQFLVSGVSGNFSVIAPGSTGTIKDFSFAGPGSANFPNPNLSGPIISFQSFGGASFTLTGITAVTLNAAGTQLGVSGIGFFTLPGFTNTTGVFDFTANTGSNTFSFSASNAAIPEPASLVLLGTGLIIISLSLRRRSHKS